MYPIIAKIIIKIVPIILKIISLYIDNGLSYKFIIKFIY